MNETVRTQEDIHTKGFKIVDYSTLRLGDKNIDDATWKLGSINRALPLHGYTNKANIMRALAENDLSELRNISNFYYNISGIYQRICDYFAFLYRYDWYVVPEIYEDIDKVQETKVLKEFARLLQFLDNSYIKKLCGEIALEVIINGSYYGYVIPSATGIVLQQLPSGFCRSLFKSGNDAVVEFNMSFFDRFSNPAYRMKVLSVFPAEIQQGYILYRENKLPADDISGRPGKWYALDPANTVKFNFNGKDVPMFVNAIPALIDLDAAQELDRRKQMQNLLKIIVQKLPMDKNGDLIFDVDEAKDIHNNAVEMLRSNAIGVDVLTTFADIDAIDTSDKNTSTTRDDLEKVERALYNQFGISHNLFNTDGNTALEKSILNDESTVRNLLLQFNLFFDKIVKMKTSSPKKYNFKFYMLETTQYNYKDLAKLYKEQVTIGYSKMLPQIALGHSQSFILNTAHFENEILHLSEVMIPPLMSSTLNSDSILGKTNQTTQSNSKGTTAGRPEKEDDQKSDKTLANRESMS